MRGHLCQRFEGQIELGFAAVHAHVAVILGLVTQGRTLVVRGGYHVPGGRSYVLLAHLGGGGGRRNLLYLTGEK